MTRQYLNIFMLTKILSNKHIHLGAFIFFYLFLIYEYIVFIIPFFGDKGFMMVPEIEKIIIGTLLFILLSIKLFVLRQPSHFIYALSLFAAMGFCIPSIIMYQFGGITLLIPLFAIVFVLFLTSNYLNTPSIKSINIKFKDQKYILLILTVLLIIPFVLTYGISFNKSVFSFGKEIYEVRAAAKLHSNIFTSYFFGPLTKVLLPSLIIYGLLRKNKLLWISGIVLMLYIFMINPHKSVFLSIFVVLAFYFFKDYRAKAGTMVLGIVFLLVATTIFTKFTGNILPESIFVRRMFFLPVYISDHYFTFFNNNHIYLSHSILNPLMEYPYSLDPAMLMGDHIYNNPLTSCNTGIIGDGYMNFGIIGCIVFTFITAIVLRFLDALNMHHSFFGISFLFLVLFLNSAFFTILLTHGGLFYILIGIFFFKNTNSELK
ncbi:MAG: O-antigen ligase [Bacteroidales bacterium]|nr:O-antigen ligase [Bacteroidales bacterium]